MCCNETPDEPKALTYFLNNLMAKMIRQRIKIIRLIRLIPCMYPIQVLLGRLGSFFFKYKYSAICDQTPMIRT